MINNNNYKQGVNLQQVDRGLRLYVQRLWMHHWGLLAVWQAFSLVLLGE